LNTHLMTLSRGRFFCELEESGDTRFNIRGTLHNGAIVTLSASLLELGALNVDLGDVGEGAMYYSIGQHRMKLSISLFNWPWVSNEALWLKTIISLRFSYNPTSDDCFVLGGEKVQTCEGTNCAYRTATIEFAAFDMSLTVPNYARVDGRTALISYAQIGFNASSIGCCLHYPFWFFMPKFQESLYFDPDFGFSSSGKGVSSAPSIPGLPAINDIDIVSPQTQESSTVNGGLVVAAIVVVTGGIIALVIACVMWRRQRSQQR